MARGDPNARWPDDPAVKLARLFHETYERLAPEYGYETRKDSAVPWADVPEKNKRLMIAVCTVILDAGYLPQKGTTDLSTVLP